MPKPKKPIREMHRWEKMMAGATDMEILLADCLIYLKASKTDFGDEKPLIERIEAQLKRTGWTK